MQRTNICLDEEQTRALKHLAAEEGVSLAELVRRAVDAYLVERFPSGETWDKRFDALISRIRARVPSDIPTEEIEADVAEAVREVREPSLASGTADTGGLPIGRVPLEPPSALTPRHDSSRLAQIVCCHRGPGVSTPRPLTECGTGHR